VVSLIAMGLLLIGHEKPSFLVPVVQFTVSETSSTKAGRISLCWLLGTSVYKIGKLRRDNLSSSTLPSPRDAPPSNVRSSKALLHEYESTGLSNKAEGWPVLSARRRKTGRECTNTLSGTPWLHALSIVYAALR
jgi:hypothetical protein